MPNHQCNADPLTNMSPYIMLDNALCLLTNFLKNLHNLLYQNPCLINLSVSSICLMTKLWNVYITYSIYFDELRDVYTIFRICWNITIK